MSEPSGAILALEGLSVQLPPGADRPHALSNGTPGRVCALRLPNPSVTPSFKELTTVLALSVMTSWISNESSGCGPTQTSSNVSS